MTDPSQIDVVSNWWMMWGVFFLFVPILLIGDLFLFHKKDHEIGLKESLKMSAFYVIIGLLFGLWVYYVKGEHHAFDYYTAFVIEKSLSLDNLFVMSVIFASFGIPKMYQHRVLVWGIIGVIVLRGVMIGAGTVIVHSFHPVLYLFAAFLIWTGFKLMFMGDQDEEEDFTQKPLVLFLKKHFRFTTDYEGHKFWITRPLEGSGKLVKMATPLFLALVVVEVTDVMFALDSIPAVLAITTDPYVVYTSNIFAILGLRALFFAVAHVLSRFELMKYALSLVLVFIGAKVFFNDFVFKISPAISLSVTLFVLLGGMIVSVLLTAGKDGDKDDKKAS